MALHPHARQTADIGHANRSFDLEAFLHRHGNQLIGVARRYSNSSADADDAYQRGMEHLLTKAPVGMDDEALAAWATTVVRNEALQIHRRRRQEVDAEFEEIASGWVSDAPAPDEALLDTEQFAHGREALSRLNPDQTRCLLLRADGLGYPEICEITGFSYAKVNRLLSEGRKAFHLHVGMIDSGLECERLAPVLSLFADGEPLSDEHALKQHLSSCLRCRSTLRDYRDTAGKLGALLPAGAFTLTDPEAHGYIARVGRALRAPVEWLQARLSGPAAEMHHGAEVSLGKKLAVVAGLGASLVVGGGAADHIVNGRDATPVPVQSPRFSSAGGVTAVQHDRSERRRADERRARSERAEVRERRRQREAAREVEAAATASGAEAAERLGGEVDADGVAADPADEAPNDAPTTDGRAEGLAP